MRLDFMKVTSKYMCVCLKTHSSCVSCYPNLIFENLQADWDQQGYITSSLELIL